MVFVAALFFLSVSQLSFAGGLIKWDEGLATPLSNPRLEKFDPTLKVGKHAGKKVWHGRWRFAQNLSQIDGADIKALAETNGLLNPAIDYYGLEDFLHGKEWYQALLPAKVERVYFVMESIGWSVPFFFPKGIVGHSFLHFEFSDENPVVFVGEKGRLKKIYDVSMTTEAGRPENVAVQPIKSFFRANGLIYPAITTFVSSVTEARRAHRKGRKIEAIELDLDDEQRSASLKEALRFSLTHAYGTPYGHFKPQSEYNCQRSSLCIIDQVNGKAKSVRPGLIPIVRAVGTLPGVRWAGNVWHEIAEFYPPFATRALGCRELVLESWNQKELPRIRRALLEGSGE